MALATGISCQSPQTEKLPETFSLNSAWSFQMHGDSTWLPAAVPGTVHTDLIKNGIIEDPYFRTNEFDQQWIDKADWVYKTTFNYHPESSKKHELVFEGLDTYADVYLNGKLIIQADNFFIAWQKEVSAELINGENEIKIHFHSPIKIGREGLKKWGYALPAVNDQSENGQMGDEKVSVFLRKPGYHFGWDWGPRLVSSGIWLPVYIKSWESARIVDVFYEQKSVSAEQADLIGHLDVEIIEDAHYKVVISQNGKPISESKHHLKKGQNNLDIPLGIANPTLWWTHNLGKPHLYDFETSIFKGTELVDKKNHQIGIRDIKIVQEPDSVGSSFYVQLNGVPIFAKGANYIPNDVFIPRVSDGKYDSLLKSAVAANMNMLRVWGGGFYEKEVFYQRCDQYGILLWQDFMFACSMYPGDEAFLENVKKEAEYNVKRLRNHASIALWCGNNEIDVAWAQFQENSGWGWKQKYSPEQRDQIWKAYYEVFHKILPQSVEKNHPQAFYWPSSPYDKDSTHATSNNTNGDIHYWGVWHGEHDFEQFTKHIGRFMSEYGFQSFPEMATVKKFTIAEDRDITSKVMAAHQRSGIGNMRIKSYMEQYYQLPASFEHQLYLGQVLQAEGMKVGFEAHRRAMPYNMGTLYWQINDCWPVASWSGMDYYQNWKGLHYFAQKAFKNLLVSPFVENEALHIQVVSDSLKGFEAELLAELKDFKGNLIWSQRLKTNIKPNASEKLLTVSLKTLFEKAGKKQSVLSVQLLEGARVLADNVFYFDRVKNLELPKVNLSFETKELGNSVEIRLTTDQLAKNVYLYYEDIEGQFSDNYFDLLPSATKVIVFTPKKQQAFDIQKLKIISVRDTY